MHYLLIIFKLGNSCIATAIHDKTKERNVKKNIFSKYCCNIYYAYYARLFTKLQVNYNTFLC